MVYACDMMGKGCWRCEGVSKESGVGRLLDALTAQLGTVSWPAPDHA